jgi:hypothetical protein
MKNFNKTPICILVVILCLLLNSCRDKIKPKPNNKFWWEAGISAPKYYPIGDVKVDLEYSGNSSLTNFDNGWGFSYGSIVSGEKFKNIPKQATIQYYSAVENLKFEGTIQLPQEKILALFNKYCTDKENDKGLLTVGMAPRGWIRVWADFSGGKNGIVLIEVAKAKLKGSEDNTISEGFRYKKSDYWTPFKTYWQHFGIPYDAWAENEQTYDIYFNFNKPNPKYEVFDVLYSTLDGTVYYNTINDYLMKNRKLPSDLVIAWRNKNDTISYDTHILMPKNLYKLLQSKKNEIVNLELEIEHNNQFGILYLISTNKKEKILRFKSEKSKNATSGDSDFSNAVEYFIK